MNTFLPLWIGEDIDAVAAEAERRFVEAMRHSPDQHFHVALSGGRTPQPVVERARVLLGAQNR